MSQPSTNPADDLPPTGPDSSVPAGDLPRANRSSAADAGPLPGTVEERIHLGAGGILSWAAGAGDDEDFDQHDLADTVDVSSTVDELVVYLDGYLDDAQRRRVEQRLIDDESARDDLAALQNSWDALDCLPRPTCSTDFTESTMRLVVQKELAVRPPGKWLRRTLGWIGVAATLVVSFGTGYLVTQRWGSAEEREFFQSYRLVRDWEKYQLIGDFEFLLRLEKEGWFAQEVPHVEP